LPWLLVGLRDDWDWPSTGQAIEKMDQGKESERAAAATRAQDDEALLAEKEKKNPENCWEPGQQPKHPSFAGHKRAPRSQARLQYCGVLRPPILDRRPTQFWNVKNDIDVKGGLHIMPVDRNVMFGLIALIAIGFVALIVGELLQ
jgi:hypothetical protein